VAIYSHEKLSPGQIAQALRHALGDVNVFVFAGYGYEPLRGDVNAS